MAIITQTILSTDEYLEVYPQDANVETDIITGSINDATITLDAICGGMIAKVWPIEDPTDPNYRTAEEKNYIKQAHAIQAHEGVCRSVDFTGGSESYTSGSNNYNQSRTTPNIVADEIIYQLLAKARVYNPNITTDTTISGGQGDRLYDPTYDPSQEYITIELGDNRYVHKHAESEDYKNKFLYYDENGNITYVELSEIILDNFYTKDEIDAKLLAYITEAQVDAKLANYYDADEIDTKFADYYTQGQIDSKLADYYTTSQVDALLNAKQNRLTAGENITISQVGQDLVISATTEPIGSVDFADITGQPSDNANLNAVLNQKALASELTTEITTRAEADTNLDNIKQNKTDNNLTTTDKTIVGAINENKSNIDLCATKTELTQGLATKQNLITEEVLWTNPNPSSRLSPIQIETTFNAVDYHSFRIEWLSSTDYLPDPTYEAFYSNDTIYNNNYHRNPNTSPYSTEKHLLELFTEKLWYRRVGFNEDSNGKLIIDIRTGYTQGTGANTSVLVPQRIVGIKI